MTLPARFASIAGAVAARVGAPFWQGEIVDHGEPVLDDGGSIVTPGVPVIRPCTVQIDSATEAMRQTDGFADGDVRFLILASSFAGGLDTDAEVRVATGPFAGRWLVAALERDPAGVGYVGRGRRA